jgi:methylphosphotriester-DNA--protein-cysteine methyltransferase
MAARSSPSLAPAPALPAVEILVGDHGGARFAPHWHDSWGLAAIEAGACHFTCAGTRCTARPLDLVLLPAHAVHTASGERGSGGPSFIRPPSKNNPSGLRMTMVYLPPALVNELLGVPGDQVPVIDRYVLRSPALARALPAAARSGAPAPLRTAARLALRRFHRACGGAVAAPRRPEDADPRVVELCSALRARSGRPDFASLARRLGISRGHFQRLFRKVVGLTPAEYARVERLARAKSLLAAGEPPAAAAAMTGFADQAHLTRWVRAVYGVTPGRIGRAPGRAPAGRDP